MEERRTHNKEGWVLSDVSDEGLARDKVTASEMLDVTCVINIHMDICVLR